MATPINEIRKPYTLKRVRVMWETFYYLLFDGDKVGVLSSKDGKYICDLLNCAYRVGWHEAEAYGRPVEPEMTMEEVQAILHKPWVCNWCSAIVEHGLYHDCKEGKKP